MKRDIPFEPNPADPYNAPPLPMINKASGQGMSRRERRVLRRHQPLGQQPEDPQQARRPSQGQKSLSRLERDANALQRHTFWF